MGPILVNPTIRHNHQWCAGMNAMGTCIQFSQHDEFALTATKQSMCVCLSHSASTYRDVIKQST